jgi:hypothetical protein
MAKRVVRFMATPDRVVGCSSLAGPPGGADVQTSYRGASVTVAEVDLVRSAWLCAVTMTVYGLGMEWGAS